MNRRDLETKLQELFEGTLDEDSLADLQHELRTSPEAKDAYCEYAHLENGLQLRADGIDLLHSVPMERVIERRQKRHLRNAVLTAAALLMLSGLVATLVMIGRPEVPRLSVATTADSLWTLDGTDYKLETDEYHVTAGSTVQVDSGTLRLRFDSGDAMVIQGPARVSFPEINRPVLKRGWLWVDWAQPDGGIEITTPELMVRDIGTRFGVRVPAQGPAEIHLIDGKVEVFEKITRAKIVTLEPEERALSITGSGEISGLELARDPFINLDELLAQPGNYTTTLEAQNPSGYWRLNDVGATPLTNEVESGVVGRPHKTVSARQPGPGPDSGFRGFDEENRAVRLPGKHKGAQLSIGTTPVHSGVLFRDNFDGKGALDGSMPDVTTGRAKWVAASSPSSFGADGRFEGWGTSSDGRRGGSATLAFTPVDGVIYTLDASVRDLETKGAWIAMGFANGQSSAGSKDSRFLGGRVNGRAWMLARDGKGSRSNQAWLGASGTTGGTADGIPWSGPLANTLSPDLDLRIVLDTSGGPGHWAATWFAKQASNREFSVIRERALLINESISSVGFGLSSQGISGTIKSFSLRADPSELSDPSRQEAGAPARVARKEGAVSFWFRRPPEDKRREILWSAGEDPGDDAIHALLTPEGRVGFFMENGRYDVLITSEDRFADGRWHHIVTSWSPFAVELFLDGRLVAGDLDSRGMTQGVLSELRFGAGPDPLKPMPFSGWVDEIAFWNRPLSGTEVFHQFKAAKGSLSR